MAALDIRHLAAPFTNKVNLTALIFIIILFAVYRLSMGALQTKEIPSQSEKRGLQKTLSDESLSTDKISAKSALVSSEKQKQTAPFQDTSSGKDLVSELLNVPSKPPVNDKDTVKKQQPLSDIEKALGINDQEEH